jgi:hypothetical protein
VIRISPDLHIFTSRVVCIIIGGVLNSMIGFIGTLYTFTTRDYRQSSAIAELLTFQFTITHALGFSVFTSRILATDL